MRVAILDSGLPPGLPVATRAAFALADDAVVEGPPHPDRVGHGSAVAAILHALAPDAALLDAQIFADAPTCSAAVVAAGLRWAVGQGAGMAVMSFGLPADRAVLAAAVAEAREAGLLLLAARPARGGPVWPAAYPGVIAVTGDARCGVGELSRLPGAYGACPRPWGETADTPPRAGGASLAVGHLAGLLAQDGVLEASPDAVAARLAPLVRWQGPERRAAAESEAPT